MSKTDHTDAFGEGFQIEEVPFIPDAIDTIEDSYEGLMTPVEFERHVEALVYDADDQITYVDAILQICKDIGMEEESAALILTPSLKAKVEMDFMNRKMLPQRGVLALEI